MYMYNSVGLYVYHCHGKTNCVDTTYSFDILKCDVNSKPMHMTEKWQKQINAICI